MKKRFDREPVCCAVCRRQADGIGYAPRLGAPIAWLCENHDCTPLGRVVYSMSERDLTHHERIALDDAGNEAGCYLEKIGKTDLACLSPEEWATFLQTVLTTFEDKMRERILTHAAPF